MTGRNCQMRGRILNTNTPTHRHIPRNNVLVSAVLSTDTRADSRPPNIQPSIGLTQRNKEPACISRLLPQLIWGQHDGLRPAMPLHTVFEFQLIWLANERKRVTRYTWRSRLGRRVKSGAPRASIPLFKTDHGDAEMRSCEALRMVLAGIVYPSRQRRLINESSALNAA
jgi:hypothetical protein